MWVQTNFKHPNSINQQLSKTLQRPGAKSSRKGKENHCMATYTFHHNMNNWLDPGVLGDRRWCESWLRKDAAYSQNKQCQLDKKWLETKEIAGEQVKLTGAHRQRQKLGLRDQNNRVFNRVVCRWFVVRLHKTLIFGSVQYFHKEN